MLRCDLPVGGQTDPSPSDLCLFKRDLCRCPYAIILNRLYIIIRTIVSSNAYPLNPAKETICG